MMKKFGCIVLALFALTACSDNDDNGGGRFPETNDCIENGSLTGRNMHFVGTTTSTSADGNVFTENDAHFETAGLEQMVLYMHKTRFAAAMPAMEMRMPGLDYTGNGKSLTVEAERVVPELSVKDLGWQPMEAYALTDVSIRIDDVTCTIRFSCDVPRVGFYTVEFAGRLYVEND